MKLKSSYIGLPHSVLIREEYFGGILFNTCTGTMIDVDREAYSLVLLIKAIGIVDINDIDTIYGRHIDRKKVNRIVRKLLALNMLAVMPQGILNKNYYFILLENSQCRMKWPSIQHISAPETVHWAVTFKCESDCPDCYIRRHRYKLAAELETKQALEIVGKIADAGVFQLAIGGGEPFLRGDIGNIAAGARERNLVVHITTGRYQHDPGVLRAISKNVKSMQIGIKHEEMLDHPDNEKEKLNKLVYLFGENGIDVGSNLMVSHSTIYQFDRIIELLSTVGFKRITLLRYKPPGDINRWMKEKPDEEDLLEFERKLLKAVDAYPHIQFRVDCGLTFLERKLPSQKAVQFGIRGCTAGDRIMSIAPDGSVFPCSQLVGDQFHAGYLLEDNLKNIWLNSSVLRKYRKFRYSMSFKAGQCGQCAAKTHCGGCRVFADDTLGADPGCPDPVLLPSKRGKHRNNDLYGTIMDIQESIGCTDGGFPYATFEEIKGWLEEENCRDYPKWLIKKQ